MTYKMMASRTDMWQYSRKLDKELAEYGARTSGSLQQREARLKRFQAASLKKVKSENYLNGVRKVQNEARDLRIQKRVLDLQSNGEDYNQTFWSPPRDPETGESPSKRQKLSVDTLSANMEYLTDRLQNLFDSIQENPTLENVQEAMISWNEFSRLMTDVLRLTEVALRSQVSVNVPTL